MHVLRSQGHEVAWLIHISVLCELFTYVYGSFWPYCGILYCCMVICMYDMDFLFNNLTIGLDFFF